MLKPTLEKDKLQCVFKGHAIINYISIASMTSIGVSQIDVIRNETHNH